MILRPTADRSGITVSEASSNYGVARTLQRLAVENDARGHNAAAARAFFRQAGEEGLRQALHDRDEPFGDGRARVNGPERRNADGRLVD